MAGTNATPPGTTRVWLLRHAETADPTVFHGAESDIGLSERGRRQAALLAPYLAALGPTAVISSGMLRARLTATPIAEACGLPLQVEPDLHERRVGALSGTSLQLSDGIYAATVARWMAGDTSFTSSGAESFDAIRLRVLPVWQRLAENHAGQSVVVVAHGVVCKVLLTSLGVGLSPADWKQIGPIHNLAIHELVQAPAGWQLVRLNDLPAVLRADA